MEENPPKLALQCLLITQGGKGSSGPREQHVQRLIQEVQGVFTLMGGGDGRQGD